MLTLIKNGTIVNKGLSFKGSLFINGNIIEKIIKVSDFKSINEYNAYLQTIYRDKEIDASKLHVIPGVIDDQVHFREPGNEHKATIGSESKAAVLGGVTSFMDMPNNVPPTTNEDLLNQKFEIAKRDSFANYSFYLGATNENISQIKNVDVSKVCGIKVFMGSSTGNMLVDNQETLSEIFKLSPILIACHCEQENIIKENTNYYKQLYGNDIPTQIHPHIRSRQACIECSKRAIELAINNNSRLHILHVSTADEVELIKKARKINPKISGEICVHYLWFNSDDYQTYGNKIKCNPAIKLKSDMLALRKAVKDGGINVVATDHAPHLLSEKNNKYILAPGGLPLVQHSLQLMLDLAKQGVFTLEQVVQRMCHGPAECFGIKNRGFLEEGYFADITLVNLNLPDSFSPIHPAYKCNWSPFEGHTFSSSIVDTFVNGCLVVENGQLTGNKNSQQLEFNR